MVAANATVYRMSGFCWFYPVGIQEGQEGMRELLEGIEESPEGIQKQREGTEECCVGTRKRREGIYEGR